MCIKYIKMRTKKIFHLLFHESFVCSLIFSPPQAYDPLALSTFCLLPLSWAWPSSCTSCQPSPVTTNWALHIVQDAAQLAQGSHFPNVNFSNYLKRIFILLILNHCCLFDVLWRGMVLCNQTLRVMAGVICESVWWAESGFRELRSVLLCLAKTAE